MTSGATAKDYAPIALESFGQLWEVTWYPASHLPKGKNHGAAGICLTAKNEIVLISNDETNWDLPAGRPEPGESLRQTLIREMREEACVSVTDCRHLGYCSSLCTKGHEKGLTLVRSFWKVDALVEPWDPQHEIKYRKIVLLEDAEVYFPDNFKPFIHRAIAECT